MIYTLTLNPSVDYHMQMKSPGVIPGEINRSLGESLYPGGKGVNVSIMLSRFGAENTALGFCAGYTGDMLMALLEGAGCRSSFVRLPSGETRINVKLDGENETAINGKGPEIGQAEMNRLLKKLEELGSDDVLILSGNVQERSDALFDHLQMISAARGVRFVADMEGEMLKKALSCKPWLIKPNAEELCGLYGEAGAGEDKIISLMKKARAQGASNVLTSMGADGAVLLTEDGNVYRAVLKKRRPAVSTVGAGDTMLAGFLAASEGYVEGMSGPKDALLFASAAGSAAAYTRWLPEADAVRNLLNEYEMI